MGTRSNSKLVIALLTMAALVILAACGDDNGFGAKGKTIDFTELDKGSGASAANLNIGKQLIAVNSQTQFDSLYSQYSIESAPSVDFSLNLVIAVQMGMHLTGGYTIGVENIIEDQEAFSVNVHSQLPGPTCTTASVLTSPYQFILTPRTEKEIVFTETLEILLCS